MAPSDDHTSAAGEGRERQVHHADHEEGGAEEHALVLEYVGTSTSSAATCVNARHEVEEQLPRRDTVLLLDRDRRRQGPMPGLPAWAFG
jgi:hypothetical protein